MYYDFSQFGLDRSQSTIAASLRTSLIVDPPDGKMPPVNAKGQKRAASVRRRGRPQVVNDSVQNMPIGSRCIIMGGQAPDDERGLQRQLSDRAVPGYVMISPR